MPGFKIPETGVRTPRFGDNQQTPFRRVLRPENGTEID